MRREPESPVVGVASGRASPVFSDAERELRRVHDQERARLLVAFALHAARAELLGGFARCAGVVELETLRSEARIELRLGRRDAARSVPELEQCLERGAHARPSCRAIADAAFALHPCAETRLVTGLARLVEVEDPRSMALDVLLRCARPRPRAIAFELVGFASLLDHDQPGARAAFEAARALRPADARSIWLAARTGARPRGAPARDATVAPELRRAHALAERGWEAVRALRASGGRP